MIALTNYIMEKLPKDGMWLVPPEAPDDPNSMLVNIVKGFSEHVRPYVTVIVPWYNVVDDQIEPDQRSGLARIGTNVVHQKKGPWRLTGPIICLCQVAVCPCPD